MMHLVGQRPQELDADAHPARPHGRGDCAGIRRFDSSNRSRRHRAGQFAVHARPERRCGHRCGIDSVDGGNRRGRYRAGFGRVDCSDDWWRGNGRRLSCLDGPDGRSRHRTGIDGVYRGCKASGLRRSLPLRLRPEDVARDVRALVRALPAKPPSWARR